MTSSLLSLSLYMVLSRSNLYNVNNVSVYSSNIFSEYNYIRWFLNYSFCSFEVIRWFVLHHILKCFQLFLTHNHLIYFVHLGGLQWYHIMETSCYNIRNFSIYYFCINLFIRQICFRRYYVIMLFNFINI